MGIKSGARIAIQPSDKSKGLMMFRRGLVVGLPIMLGYLPIAITYGVLAKQSGLSLMELTLMSVMVFAGAAQFMATNMIALGASVVEIVVATFVLNFRHFVMSLSFMNRLRDFALRVKVLLSLGLTDETFAVSSTHQKPVKEEKGAWFYAGIMIIAYFSWVFGSFLGGILGDIIPSNLSQSMGIALYAMFIGLLIPSVKKNLRVGLIAIVAMLVNAICIQMGMSTGWAIIVGTVIGAFCGVNLLKEQKR